MRSAATPAAAGQAPGDRRVVLIGFAEALAAVETAWSLVDAGLRVVAFARRGARPPLRRSKAVEVVEITAPEDDAARAVTEIGDHARATGATAVMPLDDASVWLCDRAAAADGGAFRVVGPTGENARLALDKRAQLDAAAGAGLAIPATRRYESAEEALEASDFPLVLKPALAVAEEHGRLVQDSPVVCAGRDELERAAGSGGRGRPVLVQPLLTGTGEGLFGLAGPDGVQAWSAHRRVRMMNPQGSGSSACAAAPIDGGLAEAAERMLGEAGWSGLFMVELLREPSGRAWFIELNGRPWGSMALARRRGLEYPAWAVAQALGEGFRPPRAAGAEPVRCRHLGRELVHLLLVLRGPRSRALASWPSRRTTVRDLLSFRRGDHLYNWRPGELPLLLDDTLSTLRSALGSRRAGR